MEEVTGQVQYVAPPSGGVPRHTASPRLPAAAPAASALRVVVAAHALRVVVAVSAAVAVACSGCTWQSRDSARPEAGLASGAGSSAGSASGVVPEIATRQQFLMGAPFEMRVVATDRVAVAVAIDAAYTELNRVEALISEWRPTSDASAINRGAGGPPVRVGPEMFELVDRSVEFSRLSNGAFDITFAACGGLWSFKDQIVPTPEQVSACLPQVGWRQIELDRQSSSVRLTSSGARIGLGGIGAGFGIDRAGAILEAAGFHDFFIDGGGDILIRGRHIDRPWTVGIANPRDDDHLLGTVELTDAAIATSGDYEKFFIRDGVRYHHILDPATGMPATRSIQTTVIAPTCLQVDALSTALFVMGPEAGLTLARQTPGIDALIISPDQVVHATEGFTARFRPEATP